MTVSATTPRVQYTITSSNVTSLASDPTSVTFPVTFKYLATSEVKCIKTASATSTDTTLTENTHYTISPTSGDTGTFTFTATGAALFVANDLLTFTRIMQRASATFDQTTDYAQNDQLDADTLEQNFDKSIMINQQLKDASDRAFIFSDTATFNTTAETAGTLTGTKTARASKAIKFDANGDIGLSTNDPDAQVADATAQAAVALGHANTASGHKDTANTAATNAAASEAAAAASAAAAAAVFDSFDDKYLGRMADGASATSASTTGTWAKNSSVIAVASATNIAVGQEVTGSGIPADANVISISGTNITISENMAAAGSSVSVTFTGQGVYGNFNGSKDGPGTDNDGDALAQGMLYFNTTDSEMRVYDGANWIPASAAANVTILEYTYTVAGSPAAAFTGSDDDGASLAFASQESVQVYLNGVLLVAGGSNDYTTNASTNTVTLASNAAVGDVLRVVVYKTFAVADAVPASTGGTFSGNVTHSGTLNANGIINANAGVDMQGQELVLDADADTSFHASTDDQIDIKVGGTDVGNFNSNTLKLVKDGNPTLEIEDTAETAYSGSWLSAPTVDFKHSTDNANEHGVLGILKFKGTTKNSIGVLTNNTDIARLDGISIEGSSGIGQRITDVKGGFRFKGLDGAGNFVDLMNIEGKNLKIENGGGIDFSNVSGSHSGSASALLDDYEEGTWTPTISVGTLTTARGFYTKVGRICTVSFQIAGFSDAGSSSAIMINNLPFSTSNDFSYSALGSIGIYRFINHSHDQLGLYAPDSSTNLQFWSSNKDGAYQQALYNQIGSGSACTVYGMVTYATT